MECLVCGFIRLLTVFKETVSPEGCFSFLLEDDFLGGGDEVSFELLQLGLSIPSLQKAGKCLSHTFRTGLRLVSWFGQLQFLTQPPDLADQDVLAVADA